MGITQIIQDGKPVDTGADSASLSATKNKTNSSLDKDAFLQLLVAQMKYQDPLKPTDNTQYISQLATFTQLEETQNMQSTMQAMQGNDLVGKTVMLKVTSAVTGETAIVTGRVDYVVHENGKTYLSVNDGLFSIDDLDRVVDDGYIDAIGIAEDFKKAVGALPDVDKLTLEDEEKLTNIRKVLDKLSGYQLGFLDEESVKKFLALEEQMKNLKEAAGEGDGDGTGDVEGGDGTGDVEGGDGTGEAGDGSDGTTGDAGTEA